MLIDWLFLVYAVSAIFQPCNDEVHTCKSAPAVIPFIGCRILIKMNENEKIIKFININCYLFIKQKKSCNKNYIEGISYNRCIVGDSKVFSIHTGKIQHIVLKQSVSTKTQQLILDKDTRNKLLRTLY